MFIGFNLQIDENASIFGEPSEYKRLQKLGGNHLNAQKALFEEELETYVVDDTIDGSKIQDEWFPEIEADIFISHSGKDDGLANALAGWIHETFGLRCFIDANVWGYSKTLLERMNSKFSNKRKDIDGGYLYDHESCNQVSQHVNTMLSIALQKMIDKVEAVIFLNTDNAVKVCGDTHMEKTYSPWIYSEIICTQFIRKKPLLIYRNYRLVHKVSLGIFESVQFARQFNISYTVSLKHLMPLRNRHLLNWAREYTRNTHNYEYPLDALYDFICPDEVENAKKMAGILETHELGVLQHAYSAQDMNPEVWENMQSIWDKILQRGLSCCQECTIYSASNE